MSSTESNPPTLVANSSSISGRTLALTSWMVTSKPAVLPTNSAFEEVSGISNSTWRSSPGLAPTMPVSNSAGMRPRLIS